MRRVWDTQAIVRIVGMADTNAWNVGEKIVHGGILHDSCDKQGIGILAKEGADVLLSRGLLAFPLMPPLSLVAVLPDDNSRVSK